MVRYQIYKKNSPIKVRVELQIIQIYIVSKFEGNDSKEINY